jgi:hypothetical protein
MTGADQICEHEINACENSMKGLIIIIIITGKTALSEPQPSLKDYARLVYRPSGFHFFGFHNNNFFTEQGQQPWVQPPTWMTGSLYLCPPVTGWPSYNPPPPTPGSLFNPHVARLRWWDSNPPPHRE